MIGAIEFTLKSGFSEIESNLSLIASHFHSKSCGGRSYNWHYSMWVWEKDVKQEGMRVHCCIRSESLFETMSPQVEVNPPLASLAEWENESD